MRSKFRIEDFEPINIEKADKLLDKRLKSVQKSLETLKDTKEEPKRETLWISISHWLKNMFGRHK